MLLCGLAGGMDVAFMTFYPILSVLTILYSILKFSNIS